MECWVFFSFSSSLFFLPNKLNKICFCSQSYHSVVFELIFNQAWIYSYLLILLILDTHVLIFCLSAIFSHYYDFMLQEYIQDGIDWAKVDFEDNKDCLNLFEKVCILTLTVYAIASYQSLKWTFSRKISSTRFIRTL